jgi:hypothetical protein
MARWDKEDNVNRRKYADRIDNSFSSEWNYLCIRNDDGYSTMMTRRIVGDTLSRVPISFNFGPGDASYPGYIVDYGLAFGTRNGYSYGWGADITAETRNRGIGPDIRYQTIIHAIPTWQIAVPTGYYDVRIVCGDPQYYGSYYSFYINGTLIVSGTTNVNDRWLDGTARVACTNGYLLLTRNGEAHIDFMVIS